MELKYKQLKLKEKLHYITLESIFIENKIYRDIEKCTSWNSIIKTIDDKLKLYKDKLINNYTNKDLEALTEIKIRKITKYDKDKQIELIKKIEIDIEKIECNIKNINDYTIDYFEDLRSTFGHKYERLTKIEKFDSISARRVVVANKKLFVDNKNGFIGTGLKDGDLISKCSNLDNVIIFLQDGTYVITQVCDKKYIGKNIIHVSIWKKNDSHMIYNLIYKDLTNNISYLKRFSVTSIVRDKKYNISKNINEILYFTANPNSESEIVSIYLHHKTKAKNKLFEYDFSLMNIKGRTSKGNILTKYNVRKIEQKSIGESTLGGRDIFIDEDIGKLNSEKRGTYLGSFNSEDRIIVFYKDGSYEMTSFDFSNRYKMSDIYILEKYNKEIIYTSVHQDGKSKNIYIKRFKVETNLLSRRFTYITEERGSKLYLISNYKDLYINYNYRLKSGEKKSKKIFVNTFIELKGYKALGKILDKKKRMSGYTFEKMNVTSNIDPENDDKSILTNNNNSIDDDNEELTLF